MKLHEPIDMGCEPVNTIFHDRESLVHLLTEITKFKVDDPKLPVYLPEPCIYLAESFVYLAKSRVHLAESFVYLTEPSIRLPEATPNKFFEGGELLIDGSWFLGRFLFCHMFSLAAASWTESQHEIWANSLIADEIDNPKFFSAASRLPNHLIRPRSDFGLRGRMSDPCRGRPACRPSERADTGARTFLSAVNRGLENPRSLIRPYHCGRLFQPESDQPKAEPSSSNHLVRPHQHIRRDRQTDLLRCFQIGDELELHRLFDRQIGRLSTF